jgi:hypothetical protein
MKYVNFFIKLIQDSNPKRNPNLKKVNRKIALPQIQIKFT